MEIIKRIGLSFAYVLIVLFTLFGAIADEIPSVQLEDTSTTNVINFFEFNETYANSLYYSITNPFNFYNESDFVINDYVLSSALFGYGYYNESDFSIGDYYTKVKVDTIVDSIGNFTDWDKDYDDLINTPTNLSEFNDDILWTSDFNTTFDSRLITTFYNATTIQTVRGTPSGVIEDLQLYDNIPYNITEESGAIGLDFRVNFTGVDTFNQIRIRYKSSDAESHIAYIQLYDVNSSNWENYYSFSTVPDYHKLEFTVDDSVDHIIDGLVQLRFYVPSNGNVNHIHYFDWITIADGYATPTSWDKDYNDLINKPTKFGNTTDEIFNAVDNRTFYLLSNPFNFYNESDFVINDYVLSSALFGYGYYNESDFIISDYSTTAESNNLYAPINYGDEWNKTYADTLYTNETDTTLTEDNVEEYIFDGDNTANLPMTDYNISFNDNAYTCYGNDCDAYIYFNGTSLIIWVN